MAFVDYSTAYPSVHRDGLSSILLKINIRGNMWHYLRARFDKIKFRVLYTGISERYTVDILRGLHEGSRKESAGAGRATSPTPVACSGGLGVKRSYIYRYIYDVYV